jgi:hypothetical protein
LVDFLAENPMLTLGIGALDMGAGTSASEVGSQQISHPKQKVRCRVDNPNIN